MMIYDISMEIGADMPIYKGRSYKKPKIITTKCHDKDDIHESKIILPIHTGTHIDAPLHMNKNGKDISYFKCEKMIAPCKVLDFTNINEKIEPSDVTNIRTSENEFLLFKTRSSVPGFLKKHPKKFIYIDQKAAELLVEKKPAGIGIDSLSVDRNQQGYPTHNYFLNNEIVLVEGLRLYEIPEGKYTLFLAPLKIKGVEGAPARALLYNNKHKKLI